MREGLPLSFLFYTVEKQATLNFFSIKVLYIAIYCVPLHSQSSNQRWCVSSVG